MTLRFRHAGARGQRRTRSWADGQGSGFGSSICTHSGADVEAGVARVRLSMPSARCWWCASRCCHASRSWPASMPGVHVSTMRWWASSGWRPSGMTMRIHWTASALRRFSVCSCFL